MRPAQVRMARAGLGWSLEQLAEKAGLRPEEISNYESDHYAGRDEKPARLKAVLEAAGIEFTDDGAPGVRIRPRADFIPTEELNAENDA